MLKESVALYIRLFQFVKPHWRMLVLAGVCMLPLALCSSGLAYLVKPALDDIFFQERPHHAAAGAAGDYSPLRRQGDF